MHITRRSFIHSISVVTAFFSTQGLNTFGQRKVKNEVYTIPPEVYPEPLFSMSAKQFEPMVGQIFTATSAEGRVFDVRLAEVNRIERSQNTLQGYYGECFSLIFDGDEQESLSQDMYDLRAGSVEFPALVVPVGLLRKRYEVIVNRLTR